MDASWFNGEPGRGDRSRFKGERLHLNCNRCQRATKGHSLPDDMGRERALCPVCYADEMAERMKKGAA
jgi:hypothetical protein